jgi:asparagine synthase (glutamine-hydrolysing)
VCCRDPIGVIPLYYGFCEEYLGISSNTKSLLAAGLTPRRVSPGHIVELKQKGVTDEKVAVVENPTLSSISIEDATHQLQNLLKKALSRTCLGNRSPTLAFSGGIDSVLIANYMKEIGTKPRLTCVGVEESPDLEAAERAADYLDMPLSMRIFGETEIDEHLDAILASVEEANPMKVGVAIPLYLVALDASTRSCRVIVSGNSSDELFGGYARYVEQYQRGESVRETMYSDVINSHEVNFERDWKICVDLGTELRLPYADPELTRFALSLPLPYKLPLDGKEPRKIILRRLASELGLPDEVTWRPKKAAQYSSGAAKIIEGLAKKKGKTVVGYLANRFEGLGVHRD